MAKTGAQKIIADLTTEEATITKRIAELEAKQATAEPKGLAAIALELASLRATLPAIDDRLAQARAALGAEQKEQNAAAVEALRPEERRLVDAAVAKAGELRQALDAVEEIRRKILGHGGWSMVRASVHSLHHALAGAQESWRVYGAHHADVRPQLPDPPQRNRWEDLPRERRGRLVSFEPIWPGGVSPDGE